MISPEWMNHRPVYILTLLLLSAVNQFVSGASFYKGAFKSIKNRSANMDSLVVLGTTAAWLHGFFLMVIGYHLPKNFSRLPIED